MGADNTFYSSTNSNRPFVSFVVLGDLKNDVEAPGGSCLQCRSMPDREAKRSEDAHVLFIDIVGYSKLLTNEQKARIETLKNIVRATEQYQKAKAEEKLLGLPTGDGGALV